MKPEFERVRNLLKESVTLLCKNSLKYEAELCVEGLLGVTLDHKEIFLININEIVKSNWPKENARSATASSSKEPVPSESRNRDGRSEQRESWGSRRGDSRSSDGDASSTSSESYSRKHRRVVESDSMVDLTEDDSDTQTHSNLRSLGPTRSPMQHAHTRQIVPVAMSTSNQMQAFGRVRQHDAINLAEPPSKRQFFSTEGGGPSKPGDTATDLDSLIIIKEVDGDEEGSISGFGEVVAQFSQGFGASPSFGQPAAVVGSSSGQKPDSSLYGSPGMPRQYDHLLGRKRIASLPGEQHSTERQPEASNDANATARLFISNTDRKTRCDVQRVIRWLGSEPFNETRSLHMIPPAELDEYLATYLRDVRKGDGTEYLPESLCAIYYSVDRYLRALNYPKQLSDPVFSKTDKVLKSKKDRPLSTIPTSGLNPRSVSQEEEERLWETGQLGSHNPNAMNFTMWFYMSKHFSENGRFDHANLHWGSVRLISVPQGGEFLVYKPATGDPRQRTLQIASRPTKNRDPVTVYKEYAARRPPEMCKSLSPFYLQPLSGLSYIYSRYWFKIARLGALKLQSFFTVGNMDVAGPPRNTQQPGQPRILSISPVELPGPSRCSNQNKVVMEEKAIRDGDTHSQVIISEQTTVTVVPDVQNESPTNSEQPNTPDVQNSVENNNETIICSDQDSQDVPDRQAEMLDGPDDAQPNESESRHESMKSNQTDNSQCDSQDDNSNHGNHDNEDDKDNTEKTPSPQASDSSTKTPDTVNTAPDLLEIKTEVPDLQMVTGMDADDELLEMIGVASTPKISQDGDSLEMSDKSNKITVIKDEADNEECRVFLDD